ncbi:MAG: hypothetical protein GX220_02655 [Treponema sp.]|nr:hypothetical protein [Treponema sp.]
MKNLFLVIMGCITLCIFLSCDNSTKYVTVYVDNFSDYDVTEIWLSPSISSENKEHYYKDVLKPKES